MWRRVFAVATIVAVVATAPPSHAYQGAPAFSADIVYGSNFPDPHVFYNAADDLYYAFSTNTGGPRMPAMRSEDMDTWFTRSAYGPNPWSSDTNYHDALTRAPEWAAPTQWGNEVWAPSVHQLPNGDWRAYYAIRATNDAQPRYCVSVATGSDPWGPFVDNSNEPLTCGYGAAGAIDPWLYVDDLDRLWLLWKTEDYSRVEIADDEIHFPLTNQEIADRNLGRDPAPPRRLAARADSIWAQRLDGSGLAFDQPANTEAPRTTATVLLTASTSNWEGGVIENPTMFSMNGQLHLIYSGNRWDSADYATGWARCSAPDQPCWRAADGPILASTATQNGPGGGSVFVDKNGDHQIAYHAWNAPYSSYPSYPACVTDGGHLCVDEGQRFLHIEPLCNLPNGALTVGLPVGWAFCDIDASAWFGPGVAWLAETGVTTGVSPTRFDPDRDVSRAEAITFVWRWAGSPKPTSVPPFTDLRDNAYYLDAVAWANESGIISGTSATTFSPEEQINRAQTATIFYRAAGEPTVDSLPPFADVEAGRYFTDPITWLASVGITTGVNPLEFRPFEQSSRAQFATMMCRNSVAARPAGATLAGVDPCPA